MDETLTSLTSWLGEAGFTAVVVVIGLALFKRWIVMGWVYEEARKDRDYWRDKAMDENDDLDE